jgi:hypothetical protein
LLFCSSSSFCPLGHRGHNASLWCE